MNIYGIKNITEKELNFDYDKYYKEIALKLKSMPEKERNDFRQECRKKFSYSNNIQIDIDILRKNFINLLLDKNSNKFLWILYSKYQDNENYIDKISSILKKENEIIRGGTNTYKMNGWMAHTLYVYQISNYNIPNKVALVNFNNSIENKNQIEELNKIYNTLSKESIFVLKIFCLIHDIGVIENIVKHDKIGAEFVDEVLKEIGIDDEKLKEININISLKDFSQIIKILIIYHTLISSLSTEGSDKFVEDTYKTLINNIPNIDNVKKQIPEILFLMGYGDITAVDEVLMNTEKYERTKECYYFFKEITENRKHIRDKQKVAIERICDTVGYLSNENLNNQIDDILKELNIDKEKFIENMYNLKLMRYTAPLMRTVKDAKLTINIYNELFDLISELEGRKALQEYTIFFVPDRHENDFVTEFKNGNFFECINKMKKLKVKNFKYKNVHIEFDNKTYDKNIFIKIIN